MRVYSGVVGDNVEHKVVICTTKIMSGQHSE